MVLVFFVSSYILWQTFFSIYRYLVPLEVVAPLVIYFLLRHLIARPYRRLLIASGVFLIIVGTTQAPNWGRVPWADSFFGTVAPVIPEPTQSLVLIAGSEPVAFMIAAFPAQVRFVRIAPAFTPTTTLSEKIRALLARHDGPAYVLTTETEIADADEHLGAHRRMVVRETCREVQNRVAARVVVLCDTRRTSE
jgi:hypothetical protein